MMEGDRRRHEVLPEEVLQLIVNRFEDAKDLAELSLVSPKWHRMCRQVPALILDLRPFALCFSAARILKSTLSNRQGLQSLAVELGREVEAKVVVRALKQVCSALRKLVWGGSRAIKVNLGRPAWRLCFPHLHTLELRVIHIEAVQLQALVDVCPALRVCSIEGWSVASRSQSSLRFKINPHLEELSLLLWRHLEPLTLEGCHQLRSIHLKSCFWEIGDLSFTQLQHCELYNVRTNAKLEELLLRCPLLQTLHITERLDGDFTLPSVLVIRSDRLLELCIYIWDAKKIKLVLDSSSLTHLDLGGEGIESVEVCQPLIRLHTMELKKTQNWEFVSNLLGTAPNILNLKLWNQDGLSEEKVMEALDSLPCLETLRIEQPPAKAFYWSRHPKFSTMLNSRVVTFFRKQSC